MNGNLSETDFVLPFRSLIMTLLFLFQATNICTNDKF